MVSSTYWCPSWRTVRRLKLMYSWAYMSFHPHGCNNVGTMVSPHWSLDLYLRQCEGVRELQPGYFCVPFCTASQNQFFQGVVTIAKVFWMDPPHSLAKKGRHRPYIQEACHLEGMGVRFEGPKRLLDISFLRCRSSPRACWKKDPNSEKVCVCHRQIIWNMTFRTWWSLASVSTEYCRLAFGRAKLGRFEMELMSVSSAIGRSCVKGGSLSGFSLFSNS